MSFRICKEFPEPPFRAKAAVEKGRDERNKTPTVSLKPVFFIFSSMGPLEPPFFRVGKAGKNFNTVGEEVKNLARVVRDTCQPIPWSAA